MSGKAEFALSFDPRALSDLLPAPDDVRDLLLRTLQKLVTADIAGQQLAGYRAVDSGIRGKWVLLYGQRPAPLTSAYATEIHVLAVLPHAGHDVHGTARARLARANRPTSALAHAARSRSPQLANKPPATAPRALTAAPSLHHLPSSPPQKGPLR